MHTQEEIEGKIDELKSDLEDLEDDTKEEMEAEGVDEMDDKGEEIELEFEAKKKALEKQIELLEWVIEE